MALTINLKFDVGDKCFIVLGRESDTPVVVEAIVKNIEYKKDNKTSSTFYYCDYEPLTQATQQLLPAGKGTCAFYGCASQVFKTRKEAALYAKDRLTERFNTALDKLEKQFKNFIEKDKWDTYT